MRCLRRLRFMFRISGCILDSPIERQFASWQFIHLALQSISSNDDFYLETLAFDVSVICPITELTTELTQTIPIIDIVCEKILSFLRMRKIENVVLRFGGSHYDDHEDFLNTYLVRFAPLRKEGRVLVQRVDASDDFLLHEFPVL